MAVPKSETGAYLVALTPESMDAIQAREINIPFLPFRVGRESRRSPGQSQGKQVEGMPVEGMADAMAWSAGATSGDGLTVLEGERRRSGLPNNDLYLTEPDEPVNVSREHLQLDRDGEGFHLLDRGSARGTLVEGRLVGAGQPPRVRLHDHDVIIVGASHSTFIFKFRLEREENE